MDLPQAGIGHPAVRDVRDIQRKTANRFRLFVAEGLWETNVVLDTRLAVDTFFWCPELTYSDEARRRAGELVGLGTAVVPGLGEDHAAAGRAGKQDG